MFTSKVNVDPKGQGQSTHTFCVMLFEVEAVITSVFPVNISARSVYDFN